MQYYDQYFTSRLVKLFKKKKNGFFEQLQNLYKNILGGVLLTKFFWPSISANGPKVKNRNFPNV